MKGSKQLLSLHYRPRLLIVVPCFNEEQALPRTAGRLLALLRGLRRGKRIHDSSQLLFVDDGSTDATWKIIETLTVGNHECRGLKFTRNFGHQAAILAGMYHLDADAVVTIDADLQDPPEVIADMVQQHLEGAEIVFGVRDDRSADNHFKRWSAEGYYRLIALFGVNIVFNHADFRLVGRNALQALRSYGETNLFLRGVLPMLGFRQSTVLYSREKRVDGKAKYNLRMMFALGLNGITSFTIAPLRMVSLLGCCISIAAFLAGAWALAAWYVGATLPGWTSVILPTYFLGGIQLLSIGILGEYLGKTYKESKSRPRYIIEKSL